MTVVMEPTLARIVDHSTDSVLSVRAALPAFARRLAAGAFEDAAFARRVLLQIPRFNRPGFRFASGHYSKVKPATIPIIIRPPEGV